MAYGGMWEGMDPPYWAYKLRQLTKNVSMRSMDGQLTARWESNQKRDGPALRLIQPYKYLGGTKMAPWRVCQPGPRQKQTHQHRKSPPFSNRPTSQEAEAEEKECARQLRYP